MGLPHQEESIGPQLKIALDIWGVDGEGVQRQLLHMSLPHFWKGSWCSPSEGYWEVLFFSNAWLSYASLSQTNPTRSQSLRSVSAGDLRFSESKEHT